MHRAVSIASIHQDPSVTVEMLERFVQVEPSDLLVFSTFTEDPMPKPIGKCLRLWRDGLELWADIEVEVAAHWPPIEQEPEIHAESVVGFEGLTPRLLAIVITSMPRGMLGSMLAEGFGLFKQPTQN